MSQPLFVIVSDEESGGDNSVHTAVLDDNGNQKIVALSEANQFRQIPKQPMFSVVPRTPQGLAQWNANCKVNIFKCDMCDNTFSKPYLLRNHRNRVHNVLEIRSHTTRKRRGGKQADPAKEDSSKANPSKDTVPKRHQTAEEVRTEKLEKLVVKDSSVAIQIQTELERMTKSEPKRPRYVSQKKYPCNVCGKPFASPSLLERHRSVHTRERLYPCPHCPKRCAYTDERLRHIRRAHPEKVVGDGKGLQKWPSSYTCTVCNGKTFSTKYRYTEHLKVHLNGLFQCQICNKKYAKRDNLVRHLQIHNGDRSHECNECHKRFLDVGALRSHQQIHTKDYRHKCGVCDKGFSKKKSLYDHLQRHNDEENAIVFECSICWECFNSKEELDAHHDLHSARESVTADSAKDLSSTENTTTTTTTATNSTSAEHQLSETSRSKQSEHSVRIQDAFPGHVQDGYTHSHPAENPNLAETEYSDNAQGRISHCQPSGHSGHSGLVQVEFSSNPQSQISQAQHSGNSGLMQGEYHSDAQRGISSSHCSGHSGIVHTEFSRSDISQPQQAGHSVGEFSSHPSMDFSGHSIVDLSCGHPRAQYPGHGQTHYTGELHLHSSAGGMRGIPADLTCHTCNKTFQSPEEVHLHARLHNLSEPNPHVYSQSYMNPGSGIAYGAVSTTSSAFPTNQMQTPLDQPMTGIPHSHLLI